MENKIPKIRLTEWEWINKGKREKVIARTLPEIYGFLYHQVNVFGEWKKLNNYGNLYRLPLEMRNALTYFSSHANSVYNYMADIISDKEGFLHNENYAELFQTTRDGYNELDRRKIRHVFGEEKDFGEVITMEELHGLLRRHSQDPEGLVRNYEIQPNDKTEFPVIENSRELVRYLHFSGINVTTVGKSDVWIQRMADESTFKKFYKDIFRLSICKLACGMAVIDQLTQEAKFLGTPISAGYCPKYDDDNKHLKRPTISELWYEAHALLTQLGKPNDRLLLPLIEKTELKQCAA